MEEVKTVECGVCHNAVPEERWLTIIFGKHFCSDSCEQKYLNLYSRWVETAYERKP